METNKSGKFLVGSLAIIGALVFIVHLILNSMLSLADNAVAPPKMDDATISERLAPVGMERVGEEPIVQASISSSAEAVETTEMSGPGQQVFTAVCATCHVSGLLQSPKLGSKEDWAPQ